MTTASYTAPQTKQPYFDNTSQKWLGADFSTLLKNGWQPREYIMVKAPDGRTVPIEINKDWTNDTREIRGVPFVTAGRDTRSVSVKDVHTYAVRALVLGKNDKYVETRFPYEDYGFVLIGNRLVDPQNLAEVRSAKLLHNGRFAVVAVIVTSLIGVFLLAISRQGLK